VWRDGIRLALLDFDHAQPGARVDDIAYMCWTFVLAGQDDFGLVGTRLRSRRLGTLCDAYGLDDRSGLLDAIISQQEATKALVAADADLPRSRRSASEVRATIDAIDAEIAWLRANASQLENHPHA
jgi:aminoglycoside phosphotransferase (APT) family kinase protein